MLYNTQKINNFTEETKNTLILRCFIGTVFGLSLVDSLSVFIYFIAKHFFFNAVIYKLL